MHICIHVCVCIPCLNRVRVFAWNIPVQIWRRNQLLLNPHMFSPRRQLFHWNKSGPSHWRFFDCHLFSCKPISTAQLSCHVQNVVVTFYYNVDGNKIKFPSNLHCNGNVVNDIGLRTVKSSASLHAGNVHHWVYNKMARFVPTARVIPAGKSIKNHNISVYCVYCSYQCPLENMTSILKIFFLIVLCR